MTHPNPKDAKASDTGQRRRDSRVAVCCDDPVRSQRYAKALQRAGFVFARDVSPETLASSKSPPGVIDLLICDANHPPEQNDPEHWTAVFQKTQPSIGAIAVTFREDPRWIVECVRRGAINCHFSEDDDDVLVEISSECVDRHESGVDNLKTLEERRRSIVSTHLRKAICEETIEVHFQPIVNCSDWTCGRVEALARWTDDSLGVVPAVEFVTAAEEEGFVSTLGQLVLRKSLLAIAALGERKHKALFSINVSRRQFDNPNLVKEYLATVREYEASPCQIIIEVTETAKFENDVLALSLMQEFIDAGFQLAVDDFGTGESSFLQMSHIRYSELKIDRSLVSCIFEPSGLSIMRSVIGMAKSLNMHLVAEGVEDRQTAELLKSLEIDFCQGYYFARPMALEDLASFLDENGGMNANTRTTR